MRVILFVGLMLVIGGLAFAQTDSEPHIITINIDPIAMLDIDIDDGVVLATQDPVSAGDIVTGSSDTIDAYYTSLVLTGTTRTLTASYAGTYPAGTAVQIEATDIPSGLGTAVAAFNLDTTDDPFITGIGSGNSGLATPTEITYTLVITNANNLVVGAGSTINVTLTLQDDV
jgi:hypothetical protein